MIRTYIICTSTVPRPKWKADNLRTVVTRTQYTFDTVKAEENALFYSTKRELVVELLE